jgi:hypothetical protein
MGRKKTFATKVERFANEKRRLEERYENRTPGARRCFVVRTDKRREKDEPQDRRAKWQKRYDAAMADPATRHQTIIATLSEMMARLDDALASGKSEAGFRGLGGNWIRVSGEDEMRAMAGRCFANLEKARAVLVKQVA